MAATATFNRVDRKEAFDGLVQEILLEPSKQYTDLESSLDNLVDYLHPQMDEMLRAKGRGIQFSWSVQVNYSTPLMRTVDCDDENFFACAHVEDDDEDADEKAPVSLHTGNLQIPNREHLLEKMEEARQIILYQVRGRWID